MSESTVILPIEDLKWFPEKHLQGASRIFVSSGTGRSRRSRSPFSKLGLDQYRAAALDGFLSCLSRHGVRNARGISLIPSPAEWPDSSLAQMLAWIAEVSDVQHTTAESLAGRLAMQAEPLWLFGSNAQWMTLFASGFRAHLPQQSIVFETGGSKGLVEEHPVEEVHRRISQMFGVEPQQVISEYGMCELASQAYNDFVRDSERVYRFADCVKLQVSDEHEGLHSTGIGCLVVNDPNRIDLPFPIRTQDLVELFDDQSFKLLGRLVGAPIKGCSLLTVPTPTNPIGDVRTDHLRSVDADPDCSRVGLIKDSLLPMLSAGIDALAEEVGSREDAETLWLHVTKSMAIKDWKSSLRNAVGSSSQQKSAKTWLFIPPGNHSLAMLYPLIMAVALDFNIYLRIPRLNTSMRFFDHIAGSLRTLFPTQVSLLPHQFTIGVDDIPSDVEAIFAYGSDESIQSIKHLSGLATKSFGERICIGICRANEFASLVNLINEDAFLLEQRGCMSLRWLYMVDDTTDDESINRDFKTLASSSHQIAYGHRIALAHEKRRLEILNPGSYSYLAERLIHVQKSDEARFCPELLSTAPGVLIIQKIKSSDLDPMIKQCSSINLILCSPEFCGVDFGIEQRAFGHAHSYQWDGTYQGVSLFGF